MSETLKFHPMTRVEGHGGICVSVEDNQVVDAKVEIYEGPRLIEPLVKGKEPSEVVSITCRICAICSISHRWACVKALEKALGIEVGPKVKAMRELVDLGENIESNALHVYLLSLPDLVEKSSVVDLMEEYGDYVKIGLMIKAFGNRIMEVISGRATHGENPVIGGFGKWPSKRELMNLKEEASTLLDDAISTVDLLALLDYPDYAIGPTTFMCLDVGENDYGFTGDKILISDGDEFPVKDYKKEIQERVVNHSFAKRGRYKGKPFTVGAIARIINTGNRLKGQAGRSYANYYKEEWKENPMYNILAQAVEILYCLEQIPTIVESVLSMNDEDIVKPSRGSGRGTAAVEAPRGTLYHSYLVEDETVVEGDISTPTAQNLDDIESHIKIACNNLVANSEENLETKLNTVARAYDPCISCSTHLVRVNYD